MQEAEAPGIGGEEKVQAADSMSKRDRLTYEERVAEFLEPGEQVEKVVPGRTASFLNLLFPAGRYDRQVLLTDRNLYLFELAGGERGVTGTPSRVLSKHQRGSAPVRYQVFPPTLTVGQEEIRPLKGMIPVAKWIAEVASTPSQ
jgi:hypothetical protein